MQPHLDYGDAMYQIPAKICAFCQNITLSNLVEELESAQYSAALGHGHAVAAPATKKWGEDKGGSGVRGRDPWKNFWD